MVRKIFTGVLMMSLLTSCVSKKIYNDLEDKYANLKKESNKLADNNKSLTQAKNQLELDKSKLQDDLDKLRAEKNKLQEDYTAADNNLKALQNAYNALEKNSDAALQANMKKNRELLAELDAKEKALAAEQDRLNKLQQDLKDRSQRVEELERMIASQEEGMRRLKDKLSQALHGFEGKGLTVEHKNGKVYVSMENKLLFQSGSWAVNPEGRKAVIEVGNVLAENQDISVLIEGHTDTDRYAGNGPIANNWDLSTKRATAIVGILTENKSINPFSLTAAGRGEYAPLVSNDTPEGKAKNRRIEIILTPKLDEISRMLNDL